jgi:hypothetical protein
MLLIVACTAALAPATSLRAQLREHALAASTSIEQSFHGSRAAVVPVASFDGIGAGLHAGEAPPRNPSDNSLAVGPSDLMQTVNSQVAVAC